MEGPGDVAGGEDIGVRGPQRRVDDDAVVDAQACGGGQVDVRAGPDADHPTVVTTWPVR